MQISVLIQELQAVLKEYGDLQVVSGLERAGYGEPVLSVEVNEAVSYETQTKENVCELVLDESSSHTNH